MLTAEELDRLERLAKAATPGPWFTSDWELDDGPNQDVIEAHEPDVVAPGQRSIWPGGIRHMQIANVRDSSVDDETTAANARLIAACHPQSVLSLIEMARQALPSPMADALAAGDGTLHGAIDYWQREAAELRKNAAERMRVAAILAAYSRWRRSDQDDCDDLGAPPIAMPCTPQELGVAIDRAVELLRAIQADKEAGNG